VAEAVDSRFSLGEGGEQTWASRALLISCVVEDSVRRRVSHGQVDCAVDGPVVFTLRGRIGIPSSCSWKACTGSRTLSGERRLPV
jgi:hypothetical protein